MNDIELENLLRSMAPVAPSTELVGRVQHDLDLVAAFRDAKPEPVVVLQRTSHWWSNVVWAGLGAAAAVVIMGTMQQARSTSGKATLASVSATAPALATVGSASAVMPVSSTREWVGVEDLGISFATPDSPARQMKVISMERHQWTDPRDGAEYTVEVPKEESVALPMKFQ